MSNHGGGRLSEFSTEQEEGTVKDTRFLSLSSLLKEDLSCLASQWHWGSDLSWRGTGLSSFFRMSGPRPLWWIPRPEACAQWLPRWLHPGDGWLGECSDFPRQPQSTGGHLNRAFRHPTAAYSNSRNGCSVRNNCAFGRPRCITPTQSWNINKLDVFHIRVQQRWIL